MIESIAIDGPAGVGKSTIAKMVAEKLNWKTLETGAIYRAITVFFITKNLPLDNEEIITKAAEKVEISLTYKDSVQEVYVNGLNLTPFLRTEIIEKNVALVSKVLAVRKKVREVQRENAANQNLILEGRDIGTEVLPEAILKIFLTASPEERAKRRFLQLSAQGETPDFNSLLTQIKERDRLDTQRAISPLKPARDAVIIDTTHLSKDQVANKICSKLKSLQAEIVK